MNSEQIAALWSENIDILKTMNTGAASGIRAVLLCAERNGPTYVRLSDPGVDKVTFEMVDGEKETLQDCAASLGVICYDNTLRALI